MAKISLNLVLTLLSLVISALRGALNLAAKIADLCDNGKNDGSFVRPIWMNNVEAGLEYVERAITCLDLAAGFASKDLANADES